MSPIAVNIPVERSHNSALFGDALLPNRPPAIRTLPSASKVAVCYARPLVMGPVGENAPVEGSNNSALFVDPLSPTLPPGNQNSAVKEQGGCVVSPRHGPRAGCNQTLAYSISSFAYSDDSIVIEFSPSRVHGSGGKVIANTP